MIRRQGCRAFAADDDGDDDDDAVSATRVERRHETDSAASERR